MAEKIKLQDVVALALKGYKPADIKELITLAEEAAAAQTAEKPQEGTVPGTDTADPGESPEPEKEQEPAKPSEAIDYKQLYEQTASELKAAQAANRMQSGPEPDPEKDWKDLQDKIRTYM